MTDIEKLQQDLNKLDEIEEAVKRIRSNTNAVISDGSLDVMPEKSLRRATDELERLALYFSWDLCNQGEDDCFWAHLAES